jgi:hypothetical protein
VFSIGPLSTHYSTNYQRTKSVSTKRARKCIYE